LEFSDTRKFSDALAIFHENEAHYFENKSLLSFLIARTMADDTRQMMAVFFNAK